MRVGGYRLLARIGEGGMGVVHLAQAPDGRRVALKVLRPHVIGDDESRQRLAREVASLHRVASPRVAEVLDADPWGETPYVATRYVPGLSLHQHVRNEGPIEGADLTYFAAGLLEALTAVHSVGVLHRDVKPSNVLLEGRAPVLIDFGLARLTEDSRLTHTGWLLGTPGYLAPEILYGDDPTPAADVHAWAATVVFAATGRPPYGTGPAMAVMDRVRRGEHDLSGVPADLLPMLRDALAPEPAHRPSTGQLLQGLGALAGAGGGSGADDLATAPYAAVAGRRPAGPHTGEDLTDVLGDDAPTQRTPAAPTAPTTPLTVPAAAVALSVPTREPFMEPPAPRLLPPQPRPTDPLAGTRRRLFLAGVVALVGTGFALAPYICGTLLALGTLAVRTASWTTESARERKALRGRAAWWDLPLTVVATPWYLLVATAGTLVLLLAAFTLAFVCGLVLVLVRPPETTGLLGLGIVLALAIWWGPGGARVRRPARRAAAALTRPEQSGWAALGVLALAVVLCAWFLSANGVTWDPASGAPWRLGTHVGNVLHRL